MRGMIRRIPSVTAIKDQIISYHIGTLFATARRCAAAKDPLKMGEDGRRPSTGFCPPPVKGA